MTQRAKAEAGYTLVEMLVVLVLLGIATAVSLPYAGNASQAQKLDATASQLASLFRRAQTQAYVTNKNVEVNYERNSRLWSVNGSSPRLQLDGALTVTALTIEGQVSEKEISYRFFPTGGSSGGLVVLEAKGNTTTIDLNWLTGAVTWKRVAPKS